MNNLTVIENNGILVVDSREVAKVLDMRHDNLVRDIEKYIENLENSENSKLRFDVFFIESSYLAGTGKNYKNYLLTKKGCELVAHKRTGKDGVVFTALYIEKFHLMEETLRKPMSIEDMIIASATEIKAVKGEVKAVKGDMAELKHKVENHITLDHGKQMRIQKAIRTRVYQRNEETGVPKEKLFSALHRTLWYTFDVSSYKDIKTKDYNNALNLINTWIEKAEIRNNSQNEKTPEETEV